MRLKGSNYLLIVIMIVMAAVIANAATFRYFQSKLLPLLVAGMVFVLSGVQLWRELTGKEASKAKKEAEPPPAQEEGKPASKRGSYSLLAVWLLGLALGILLLGHLIAVPLFLLSYIRWRGRGWIPAIAMAVGVTGFFYFVFSFLLRMELYPGLIYELVTGGIRL